MVDNRVPGTGQLTGRPLLDSRADMALYTPRRQVETQIRNAFKRGLNTLLEGPPGSGKTTILRSLMHQARQKTWAGPTPISEVLYSHYATAPNVRKTLLLVADAALTLAVDDRADTLTPTHCIAAITQTDDGT